jgi:peptidyl-prolyl cis-trans isomerase C
MKNLVLMLAILTAVFLINGCGGDKKAAAEQDAALSETEAALVEQAEPADVAAEEVETIVAEPAKETVTEPEATPEKTETAAASPETDTTVKVAPEAEAPAATPVPEVVTEPEAAKAVVETATPDAVVVTVNGQAITEKEIDDELQKAVEMMKKRMPPGMELTEERQQQMRSSVVDRKVEQTLLTQEMKKKGLEISDQAVLDEIKKIAGQRDQTMEDVEKEIAEMGLTLDDIKGQVRYQMQIKALMESEDPNSVVTEADAKKFYDENSQYFEKPEQVRASHILIKVEKDATDEQKAAAKEKIEGLLKRAKAGEDFAVLAKEYTEDPGSKENGGEYTFPRGQMAKPFEDAAFGLEVGQISDVVETQYGYHIIKLSEKIEASKASFEEAKEKIMQFLTQQKEGQFWSGYQKALHDNAVIKYSEKEQALRDELEKAAAARAAERQAQMEKAKAAREAKAAAQKTPAAESAEK